MSPRRVKTKRTVSGQRRVYRVVNVTREVLQCERPYVLFGAAVREARLDMELSQQELADRLGYSRGSIANIELGRQRVLLSDVFAFAKALCLDPKKLFAATAK